MPAKPIIVDYTPRRQFVSFHQRSQRWAALVCHRRAGKTVASLNDQIKRAMTVLPKASVAKPRPSYFRI
jgi:phage terminase large subunit